MAANSIVQEPAAANNTMGLDAREQRELDAFRRYERHQAWRAGIPQGVKNGTEYLLREFFGGAAPFDGSVDVRADDCIPALLDTVEAILRDFRDGMDTGTPEGSEYLRDALGYLATAAAVDLRRRDHAAEVQAEAESRR